MAGNLAGTIGPPDWSSGSSAGNACGVGFGFEDTGIEPHSSSGNCNLGVGTPVIWEFGAFKSTQLDATFAPSGIAPN